MPNNEQNQIFEQLLEYLRQSRGFDFTGYKRSSLQRRVRKQMQVHDIHEFGQYLDHLQVHPEEFLPLFNTILINVTAFFRDKEAWNYLQDQTLPHLLNDKTQSSLIRVWSAGCASGEEAYTLAMIFAEILGTEQFRQRVKIYATDIDEEALTQARHASYNTKQIEDIPNELQEKYFEHSGNDYIFRSDLRRAVIFGRHDLIQDAPISRLDLLVCRNTLMYFNAETQSRILDRFHFALNDTGVLFLGKAEMLLTHANIFTPLSLQHRIFRRVPQKGRQDRLILPLPISENENGTTMERYLRLRELSFEHLPLAEIIIDYAGNLVVANAEARSRFSINVMDAGRPLQDLEISYRLLELRSQIDQVYQERRKIMIRDIVFKSSNDQTFYLDIELFPIEENTRELLGVAITFNDVTRYHELQEELNQSKQELETANEELQSSNEELETTNEELQSTNEELETTNEELQSTNEELETTNEELQSTNEELETMNEELQSTNQELQTINDELRLRTNDLDQANAFLQSVFASLQWGVIVVDRQFKILTWNHESENLWGLRSEEVQGLSFLTLDIGLPVGELRDTIRFCLSDQGERQERMLNARNRRGKDIQFRITFNPLGKGLDSESRWVIMLMEQLESEGV